MYDNYVPGNPGVNTTHFMGELFHYIRCNRIENLLSLEGTPFVTIMKSVNKLTLAKEHTKMFVARHGGRNYQHLLYIYAHSDLFKEPILVHTDIIAYVLKDSKLNSQCIDHLLYRSSRLATLLALPAPTHIEDIK